jgi:hypothetical protein
VTQGSPAMRADPGLDDGTPLELVSLIPAASQCQGEIATD